MTCRMKRADVIDNANIQAGDVVVGLASAGQATYETEYQASERERWSERERERERETATYEAEYQASVCVREERVWAGVAYKTEYQASVWGRERGRETFIYEGSDCGCDGGGGREWRGGREGGGRIRGRVAGAAARKTHDGHRLRGRAGGADLARKQRQQQQQYCICSNKNNNNNNNKPAPHTGRERVRRAGVGSLHCIHYNITTKVQSMTVPFHAGRDGVQRADVCAA